MKARAPRAPHTSEDAREPPRDGGLALGFVACAPLLAAYELALPRAPEGARAAAELFAGALLRPLGGAADGARRIVLLSLFVWALARASREPSGLVPRLARRVGEGLLGALALGPVLLLLLLAAGMGEGLEGLGGGAPAAPPSLARAGLVAGGAAWEELVFRLGLYPALLVLLARTARALSGGAVLHWIAETLALALSSLAFAASHLAFVTDRLGPGGESFDPVVFTWRAAAGMLFGGLFRWRGLATVAWAHALFDLALLLGGGPEVFLL